MRLFGPVGDSRERIPSPARNQARPAPAKRLAGGFVRRTGPARARTAFEGPWRAEKAQAAALRAQRAESCSNQSRTAAGSPPTRPVTAAADPARRIASRDCAGKRRRPKEPSRCVGFDVIATTSSRSIPSGVASTLRRPGSTINRLFHLARISDRRVVHRPSTARFGADRPRQGQRAAYGWPGGPAANGWPRGP
jgi:hypothetical protein